MNEGDPDKVRARITDLLAHPALFSQFYADVLRNFDAPESVLSTLQQYYADKNAVWPDKLQEIATLAAYFGFPEFSLLVISEEVQHSPLRLPALWHPVMASVRRLDGFNKLVEDLRLTAYWQKYGWADSFQPLDDNDFVCS